MILICLFVLGLLIVSAAYERLLAAEQPTDFDDHADQALDLGGADE